MVGTMFIMSMLVPSRFIMADIYTMAYMVVLNNHKLNKAVEERRLW